MSRPLTSICILSFNRKPFLTATLDSLLEQRERLNLEIIAVDNGSSDGSADVVRDYADRFGIIGLPQEKNWGVSPGRNIGYRVATGDFLLSLDEDSIPSLELLEAIPDYLNERKDVALLAPLILNAATGNRHFDYGDEPRAVANFSGAAYAFRRSLLMATGGLDDKLFFGGEELDFSMRAFDLEGLTMYEPGLTVRTDIPARVGGLAHDRLIGWTYSWHRVLAKNLPLGLARRFSRNYMLPQLIRFYTQWELADARQYRAAIKEGFASGLADHRAISAEAVRYYSNPSLEPVFGNRSVGQKLIRKLLK
ncbi:MAG: glycosyltransferase family 2 protein [Fimbriimonadaceae bacterium]